MCLLTSLSICKLPPFLLLSCSLKKGLGHFCDIIKLVPCVFYKLVVRAMSLIEFRWDHFGKAISSMFWAHPSLAKTVLLVSLSVMLASSDRLIFFIKVYKLVIFELNDSLLTSWSTSIMRSFSLSTL